MTGYADAGFLGSLYLVERTSAEARAGVAKLSEPLPIIPLAMLELRNMLNLAIVRGRINQAERDASGPAFKRISPLEPTRRRRFLGWNGN